MSENEETPESNANKHYYRQKVWDYLVKNNLAVFPPPYGRIPNFKGSNEVAAKLLELDEFKEARNVEVNPDKPQESVRIIALENQKNLYVPVPRLKEGLLKHISVPEGSTKNQIREAVTRRGLDNNGKAITIGDQIDLDMLVLGSVAVSKEGYRIGKGRGYADLEFAILLTMNAVTEKTVVVTVVHDCQVFDTFPKEMFQEYDVPVDIIVTPTQIILVEKKLPRPPGILWNFLSRRKLNLMPILQRLKEQQEKEGKEITLKEVDTDVESYEPYTRFKRLRRFSRRRPRSNSKAAESQGEDGSGENSRTTRRFGRSRRFSRRHSNTNRSNGSANETERENRSETRKGENKRKSPSARKNFERRRPFRRNRFQVDFSLMVGNIERNVRVRDLKKALNDNGIKPNEIIWQGYKGFCYLHYAKTNGNTKGLQEPIVVDNVIEILQSLKITPDSETNLSVKVVEPVSRIETTDVTAV